MADETLNLKLTADAGGAIAGVDKLDESLKNVETTAKDVGDVGKTAGAEIEAGAAAAAPALAGVEAAAKEAGAALEAAGDKSREAAAEVATGMPKAESALLEVEAAAKRLEAELQRLDKADTARGLAQGSARAKVALEELDARARSAGVSVEKFGVNAQEVEKKLNGAAAKAGALRDAMGDMTTRGNMAAQGMEAVAGRAGSLDGILGGLKDTGGKTAQGLADIGFAATALTNSFSLGYDAGKQYLAFMKEFTGKDLTKAGAVLVDMALGAERLAAAYNLIPFVETKMKAQSFADVMEKVASRHEAAWAAARKYAAEMENGKIWLKDLGYGFTTFTEAQEKAKTSMSLFEAMLRRANETGEPMTRIWRLNATEMDAMKKEADLLGINLEKLYPSLATGIKFTTELAEANKNLAGTTKAVADAATTEAAAIDKRNAAMADAHSDRVKSVKEYGAALDKTADSTQSAARQELAKEESTARAGLATAKTAEEYTKYSEALEAVKQKTTLLTISEEKLAQAIGEAGRANESFTAFLPTSTDGLRDFASAVDGPIDSLQRLAQQFTYLSDQTSGWMSVWVEPLITDLEMGKIGIEQFSAALEKMQSTAAVLSAWSMGTVTEYQNMLAQMSVAEQEYFDRMRAMHLQAVADAHKTAIALRDAKYLADLAAPGGKSGMGGGAGGSMGAGSGGAGSIYGGGISSGGGSSTGTAGSALIKVLAEVPR